MKSAKTLKDKAKQVLLAKSLLKGLSTTGIIGFLKDTAPKNPSLSYCRGQVEIMKGNYNKAQNYLEAFLNRVRKRKSINDLYKITNSKSFEKKVKTAIVQLREIVLNQKWFPQALSLMEIAGNQLNGVDDPGTPLTWNWKDVDANMQSWHFITVFAIRIYIPFLREKGVINTTREGLDLVNTAMVESYLPEMMTKEKWRGRLQALASRYSILTDLFPQLAQNTTTGKKHLYMAYASMIGRFDSTAGKCTQGFADNILEGTYLITRARNDKAERGRVYNFPKRVVDRKASFEDTSITELELLTQLEMIRKEEGPATFKVSLFQNLLNQMASFGPESFKLKNLQHLVSFIFEMGNPVGWALRLEVVLSRLKSCTTEDLPIHYNLPFHRYRDVKGVKSKGIFNLIWISVESVENLDPNIRHLVLMRSITPHNLNSIPARSRVSNIDISYIGEKGVTPKSLADFKADASKKIFDE